MAACRVDVKSKHKANKNDVLTTSKSIKNTPKNSGDTSAGNDV